MINNMSCEQQCPHCKNELGSDRMAIENHRLFNVYLLDCHVCKTITIKRQLVNHEQPYVSSFNCKTDPEGYWENVKRFKNAALGIQQSMKRKSRKAKAGV